MGDKCGVEVIYSLHDGVPRYIRGDQRRIVQILLNLASNAIKYTAPVVAEQSQKGLVTLLLQYSAEMKTIRMCVFDTGKKKAFWTLVAHKRHGGCCVPREIVLRGLGDVFFLSNTQHLIHGP